MTAGVTGVDHVAQFWREYSENPRGFEPDMPVVCERFRLLRAERAGAPLG